MAKKVKKGPKIGNKVGYITPLTPDGEAGRIEAIEFPWQNEPDLPLFTVVLWNGQVVHDTGDNLIFQAA